MRKEVKFKDDSNRVEIYIWNPRTGIAGEEARIGHISIKTYQGGPDNRGYYISFWPDYSDISVGKINFPWEMTRGGVLSKRNTLEQDCCPSNEGPVDDEVILYSLDAALINECYEQILSSRYNWSFWGSSIFRYDQTFNCAGLAIHLLERGGIEQLLSPSFYLTEKLLSFSVVGVYFLTLNKREKKRLLESFGGFLVFSSSKLLDPLVFLLMSSGIYFFLTRGKELLRGTKIFIRPDGVRRIVENAHAAETHLFDIRDRPAIFIRDRPAIFDPELFDIIKGIIFSNYQIPGIIFLDLLFNGGGLTLFLLEIGLPLLVVGFSLSRIGLPVNRVTKILFGFVFLFSSATYLFNLPELPFIATDFVLSLLGSVFSMIGVPVKGLMNYSLSFIIEVAICFKVFEELEECIAQNFSDEKFREFIIPIIFLLTYYKISEIPSVFRLCLYSTFFMEYRLGLFSKISEMSLKISPIVVCFFAFIDAIQKKIHSLVSKPHTASVLFFILGCTLLSIGKYLSKSYSNGRASAELSSSSVTLFGVSRPQLQYGDSNDLAVNSSNLDMCFDPVL